jgi:integrase
MKDATMKMIRESTPDSDGIIEIKSRYGTKRITLERLSEITMESFILGGLAREGTNKEQCRQIWNRLIEEEVARVLIFDLDGQPLFQSVNSLGTAVTGRALNRYNAWAAIRKRAKAAGFLTPVGCHTWRATGITIYLENDGRLEHAQQMAGHESPRTTKLYDRTKDEITLSEVERIRL